MKYWTNVAVAIASLASGYGAATTITAISKANPAVVTYSGADPAGLANDAIVLLEVQGMTQVNNRLFKVASYDSGANTFALSGIDSTLFRTFSSGTFKVITFDLNFSTLTEPQGSGGDPVFEDIETIHDSGGIQDIVSSTPENYSFVSHWDPSNAALIEANKAFVARTGRAFKTTFSDGSFYLYFATMAVTLAPGASGRKVTTPVALALKATGTSYAS
jgi:hypothetical protein